MAKQAELLDVDEARRLILEHFPRLDAEMVALESAAGRVLAHPVQSPLDLPPFANSSMDGFALAASATSRASPSSPVELPIVVRIPAGARTEDSLGSGQAARIMTGAPLPVGADAVVPFEDVEDRGDRIVIRGPIAAAACVRPAGQDAVRNAEVLAAGTVLGAQQIGLLAALGYGTVSCVRRPLVAVLSTGDELVPPGTQLRPGQIYNSNSPMLAAAVAEAGGSPRVLRTVGDEPDAIGAALREATDAQLLITSGGASVGDFDHVKAVIGRAGAIRFWRVRVRPGKPLIFGRLGDVPVVGLPGNPTSAMVTFELFVRPAIRSMIGAPVSRPEIEVVVDEPIENRGGRRTYARVRLHRTDGRYHAFLAGPQDSAMLVPLARADGLLVIPEDRDLLPAGAMATVLVWNLPPGRDPRPGGEAS